MATDRNDSEDKGNINCKQLKLITLIALGRTRVREGGGSKGGGELDTINVRNF